VADLLEPDRVVLGTSDRVSAVRVAALYEEPLKCQIMLTDMRAAEMNQYASNPFLATLISFIDEIAAGCDRLGFKCSRPSHPASSIPPQVPMKRQARPSGRKRGG
jgi:UDP-glucose 6-dehydrogenase